MTTQLFEGKEHASLYQKYRLPPPDEVQKLILSYLEAKKQRPFSLAVDVGCGTGQSTRALAPHFEKMVGTDISKAQIEEAKQSSSASNISYCVSPAEELPFEDSSVDLVTAAAAAHWFNIEKFLKEVDRILKPSGCMALYCYQACMEVHYKDCASKLTAIFTECYNSLAIYTSKNTEIVYSEYEAIFNAIPYTDKKRITQMVHKFQMPVADLIGLVKSFSMFQTFLQIDPEAAKKLLQKTEQRFLEVMGVTSNETIVEIWAKHFCVLACKPL
uniref:Methyltransferase DDB_G0268948 n=1 Tax=Geotrypetes seraphini TaxID=260995 RepID=A0A6P8RD24_GEOSA|nr:putative methyltransferase DDB_G0268948 [Geotrypetes seraphini]XP_033800099.1 putative methyltransferase DDB_G0268948 [Geotrypetes seraphini]XP_033800100.1 putative methyltransferase DDB_G0268948 [Geotrypetes seraphini]XP_033800101.1 putative methyltransferase DDB_G0268948 [Geotrypetes seraphini]XP_033800102.1 putative methyltransferase DDB_G0268948 [Geotrypetes seraphini]XP_033800103.1 putative methyltransferase DDB_G0268948 [Geotrypetes seraphini]